MVGRKDKTVDIITKQLRRAIDEELSEPIASVYERGMLPPWVTLVSLQDSMVYLALLWVSRNAALN